MATAGKSKKEKKKPILVKTSLNNPYNLTWTPLEKGLKGFIIKTLTDKMDALGFRKTQIKTKVLNRRKAKKRGLEQTQAEQQARLPGWSDEAVRRQLAIGINEVTKSLEKDKLSLVLVCSSAKPAHMTSHLIPLSKTRAVPACQVPDLSHALSGLLGVSSALALGFRRGASNFTDTVSLIAAKVPPLHVVWMPDQKALTDLEDRSQDRHSDQAKSEEQREESKSDPVKTKEQAGDPQSGLPKGQKRKLDISLESAEDPGLSLQPLKIKKTIPNPSKIRKPKRKTKK